MTTACVSRVRRSIKLNMPHLKSGAVFDLFCRTASGTPSPVSHAHTIVFALLESYCSSIIISLALILPAWSTARPGLTAEKCAKGLVQVHR